MADKELKPSTPSALILPGSVVELELPEQSEAPPSAQRIKTAIRRIGRTRIDPGDPDSPTYAEALAFTAWKRAVEGNREWAVYLSNRAEGMPLQGVEVGGADGGPIAVSLVAFGAPKPIDVVADSIVDPIEELG